MSDPQKKRVTLFAKNGVEKDHAVNKDGNVNLSGTKWIENNGGPIPIKDVPEEHRVKIPRGELDK